MKVLVGVDLSEATEKIIKKAKEVAKAISAKVWIVHIVKPEPADFYIGGHEPDSDKFETDPKSFRDSLAKRFHVEHRQLQEIADRLRKAGLEGEPAETMLKEASKLDVDIIVVGSHGRGSMHQLLMGSVSEGVIRRSECPILVVPTHERT